MSKALVLLHALAFLFALNSSPALYGAGGTVIAWGSTTNVPSGLVDVVAVAAGGLHSLALRQDGTVVAWGDNTYGQTNVPSGLSNVVAIAGGFRHSIALRNDGTVAAWGYNASGQTNVPTGLSNVTAIAAGGNSSLALRDDSTVATWGTGANPGSTDLIAIAAADSRTVALRNDGTLRFEGFSSGSVPASATNIIAISAFEGRTIVLRSDGRVIAWGTPLFGDSSPSNVSNAVAIAVGATRAVILTENGNALMWSLGFSASAVADPTGYSNIVAVAAGGEQFLAIQQSTPCLTIQPHSQIAFRGKPIKLEVRGASPSSLYYQWYHDGQPLPDTTNTSLHIPGAQGANVGAYSCVVSNVSGVITSAVARLAVVPIAGWGNNLDGQAQISPAHSNIVAVSAGESHSLGLRADGIAIGWGDNSSGKATPPPGLSNVLALAAGGNHSLALRTDGTVVAWGTNDFGQTNVPSSATNIIGIAAGTSHSMALRADGSVVAWGNGAYGLTNTFSGNRDFVQIAAAGTQNIALRRNGTSEAWGQYGSFSFPPVGATNLVSVAAAPGYYVGLHADGRVSGWPLGLVNPLPTVPSNLSNVVAVAAGGHSQGALGLALKNDGTVTSWGSSGVFSPAPLSLSNVTSLSAVARHVLATVGNGSPHFTLRPRDITTHIGGEAEFFVRGVGQGDLQYSWSFNGTVISDATNRSLRLQNVQSSRRGVYTVTASNSLGATSASARLYVVPVVAWGAPAESQFVPSDLEDVTGIAVGFAHSLALLRDGTVRAWGRNTSGQASPPNDLGNVVALAAGDAHSLALQSNGTLVGWGDNSMGQITVPSGLEDFIAIDARNRYTLALRQNGTVAAWGDGTQGQTNIPLGLANVTAIAAGQTHAAAALASGRVVVWGANNYGQYNIPIDLRSVVALSAGGFHTAALTASGSVAGWGYSDGRQTSLAGPLMSISAGLIYTLGVTDKGTVRVLDLASLLVPTLSNIVAVASKANHQLALVADGAPVIRIVGGDRTVYSGNPIILGASVVGGSGLTYQWQKNGTNIPAETNTTMALPIATASDVGSYRLIASNSAGSAISTETQVAITDSAPFILTHPLDQTSYVGGRLRLQSVADGSGPLQYQWRLGETSVPGATHSWLDIDPLGLDRAGDYSLRVTNPFGASTSYAARVSIVHVVAWGANDAGQVTVPPAVTNVIRVATGHSHSLALKQDRTVVVWGNSGTGLADIPANATNIAELAAGRQHSLALTRDGDIIAWGNNSSGQTAVPAGVSNVLAIAAGENHSLALRHDGTIAAWGASDSGATNVPASATNVVSIASASSHSVALLDDGTVKAWGSASGGRINVPAGLSNVVSIAAGNSHSLALKGDGTVVGWGTSAGIVTNVPPDATNMVSVAVGNWFALAGKADGTITTWGVSARTVPQNLPRICQVAAGDSHALALFNETPQQFQIEPVSSGGGPFTITARTERGCVYRLEYKNALADTQWVGFRLVAGNGEVQTFSDPDPPSSQRFYRIGRW